MLELIGRISTNINNILYYDGFFRVVQMILTVSKVFFNLKLLFGIRHLFVLDKRIPVQFFSELRRGEQLIE